MQLRWENIELKEKIVVVLFVSFIFACTLNGISAKDRSNQNNETDFVVDFNPEFTPLGYQNESEYYTAFDIELARTCNKR